MIFFTVMFFVLLIAGRYLERLSWEAIAVYVALLVAGFALVRGSHVNALMYYLPPFVLSVALVFHLGNAGIGIPRGGLPH